MKRVSLFGVVVLTFIVISCSLIEVSPVISLSVDPRDPVVASDVTITLSFSPVVGDIQAEISINGVTVLSTDTVPAVYTWKPEKSGNYVIAGRVAGDAFKEVFEKSILIEVRDTSPPIIESVSISPQKPESDDDVYVMMIIDEDETPYITIKGWVDGLGTFNTSFSSPPYYLELSPLDPGTHTLLVTVENAYGLRDSTEVDFYVFEKDDTPPIVTLEFLTDLVETGNIVAQVHAQDDTKLKSLRISIDGSTVREFLIDTDSFTLPLNLGTLTVGNHTIEVFAEDVVGKEQYFGRYFSVSDVPDYLRLTMTPSDPNPNDVVIFSYETNLEASDVSFYVNGEVIDQNTESAAWVAKPGSHFVTVRLTSTGGKTLVDGFSFSIGDDFPPRIVSLLLNGIDITENSTISNSGEYIDVKLTVWDETGLPKGGNVVMIISKTPMPYMDVQDFTILSQQEISYDTKIATYTGYIKVQPGTYFLIINDLKDSLDNNIGDSGNYYQYKVEVVE